MQRSYTQEYRVNAVKLAKEIGIKKAVEELKMPHQTLYEWMVKAKNGELPEFVDEAKNSLKLAEKLKLLEKENKMLKSENAQIKRERQILEEATAFFAARQKK